MTPHYDWTPASEPPDTPRNVIAWLSDGTWIQAHYRNGEWRGDDGFRLLDVVVTHWRDVSPPDVEAPQP